MENNTANNSFIKNFKDILQETSEESINQLEENKNYDNGYRQGILKKSRDVAISLLQEGFDTEKILKITNLSKEELKKL